MAALTCGGCYLELPAAAAGGAGAAAGREGGGCLPLQRQPASGPAHRRVHLANGLHASVSPGERARRADMREEESQHSGDRGQNRGVAQAWLIAASARRTALERARTRFGAARLPSQPSLPTPGALSGQSAFERLRALPRRLGALEPPKIIHKQSATLQGGFNVQQHILAFRVLPPPPLPASQRSGHDHKSLAHVLPGLLPSAGPPAGGVGAFPGLGAPVPRARRRGRQLHTGGPGPARRDRGASPGEVSLEPALTSQL